MLLREIVGVYDDAKAFRREYWIDFLDEIERVLTVRCLAHHESKRIVEAEDQPSFASLSMPSVKVLASVASTRVSSVPVDEVEGQLQGRVDDLMELVKHCPVGPCH